MQISHNAQVNIFDQCRGIPASEAARREGLELKRRGNREWACCPFHHEKTASLAFDRNGRFYCFGCKEHGDAVAFVAKLHSLTPREAAERLLGGYGGSAPPPQPRAAPPPGRGMKQALEQWHREEWDRAKERLDRETGEMAKAESAVLAQAKEWDDVWEDPAFCAAILLKSAAQDRLNQLEVRDEDALGELFLYEAMNGRESSWWSNCEAMVKRLESGDKEHIPESEKTEELSDSSASKR